MTSTEVETEYQHAYGRGHACGTYLLGEYDREEMLAHFTARHRILDEFLEHYDCEINMSGVSSTWYRGFRMGLQYALCGRDKNGTPA